MWRSLFLVGLLAAGLADCTSVADEVRRKCASATDPQACEKAEVARMRAEDSANLNVTKGSGGGY